MTEPAGGAAARRLTWSSGGAWLLLGGLFAAGAAAWFLLPWWRSGGGPARGDGANVESYGFDLAGLRGDRAALAAGGMAADSVPVLDAPVLISVTEAEERSRGLRKFLVGGDRVVGLVAGDEARAYPLRLLQWHEAVHDRVGGIPVLVTYGPLTDSVVVFDLRRADGGAPLRFGHSGLVWNSDALLYDRAERGLESLWSRLRMEAVAGPRAGEPLTPLPCAVLPWREWKVLRPDSRVMAEVPAWTRAYAHEPYTVYLGHDDLEFPVSPAPPSDGLARKQRCLAVRAGGAWRLYPLSALAARADSDGAADAEQAGVRIRFRVEADGGSAAVEAPGGEEVLAVPVFRFAWHAARPEDAEIAR